MPRLRSPARTRSFKRPKLRKSFAAKERALVFVLLLVSGCSSLREITIDAGGEASMVRFFSVKKDPLKSARDALNPEQVSGNNQESRYYHSEYNPVVGGYIAASLPPAPLPLLGGLHPYLSYIQYSVNIKSPRIYRGTLKNYPDLNVQPAPKDPGLTMFFEHTDPPDFAARRMDYLYEEFQFFLTLYLPYLTPGNWLIAPGLNWGNARYNFELHETLYAKDLASVNDVPRVLVPEIRVSNVQGHYRPLLSTSILVGYKIGVHFSEESLLHDSYLILEYSSEDINRHALKTDLRRAYGGANPNPLYATSTQVRFGIRKSLKLFGSRGPK